MGEAFKYYNSIPKTYFTENLINRLLDFFIKRPSNNDQFYNFFYNELSDKPIELTELIGLIHQKKQEQEKIDNTNKRKHLGIYYTDYDIARLLAKNALKDISPEELTRIKFFEPCVGGGIFVIAYIDEIMERLSNDTAILETLFTNIYYSDIDESAVRLFNSLLPLYIQKKYNYPIKIKNNFYIGDVLFNKVNNIITKNNPLQIFNLKDGFDVILTNPPYKLLKGTANKYNGEYFKEIDNVIKFIKKNNIYPYNEGTLNYYKLFVEDILENFSNNNAKIGLLIPNTLLTDKQSEKLRKRILSKYNLNKIYTIPEKNNFFPDITQAFCFLNIDKKKITTNIEIIKNIESKDDFKQTPIVIDYETIKSVSESHPIIVEDDLSLEILKKISKHRKLKELKSFKNLRGELDLTFHKQFITKNKTGLQLVKGINIAEFKLKTIDNYVGENFINQISAKSSDIIKERIACQQISNVNNKKRLKFALVKPNTILGNSCNYLSEQGNLFIQNNVSLKYLLALLNSHLLDWRFRITNSNNHIGNHELDELPIAIPDIDTKNNIEKIVDVMLLDEGKNNDLQRRLNNYVFKLYNINDKEADFIQNKYL